MIIDQVLNHTAAAYPWFVESRASRDNPPEPRSAGQRLTNPYNLSARPCTLHVDAVATPACPAGPVEFATFADGRLELGANGYGFFRTDGATGTWRMTDRGAA